MAWNWQISGWPEFRYDEAALAPLEQRFLLFSGEILGASTMSTRPSVINSALIC